MARTYHPRGVLVDGFKVREHPLYAIWFLMLQRCTNPKATGYKNYGGRGISVCERWYHFANFAADMNPRPSLEHTLDRRENDGNYEPSNCRWVLRAVQNNNKRAYATSETGESGIRHRNGRYQVRIIENGKRKSIGNYDTFEQAIAAKKSRVGSKAAGVGS